MLYGSIQGFAYGIQTIQLRVKGYPTEIFRLAQTSGVYFGSWLGSYQAVNVALIRTRGERDAANSVIAGFVAGAVASIATRSRNPLKIVTVGAASAVLVGSMSLVGSKRRGGCIVLVCVA
jgi:hypothetical protein